MKIYRPLQLSFCHRVLEQNRKFYFIASATLGVRLQTGEEFLEFDYLKDAFECMGESPLPDVGMPKPNGEFLVSGSFYPAGNKAVPGGEVTVKLGGREKRLYVFGPRQWRAGTIAGHETVTSMPIDYQHAFGGEGYDKNPVGMGYKDGLLPCVEDPKKLVTSPNDRPEPAGFSPLDPGWPQRRRFQGTYDDDYKLKYFPGYPEDHDWRSFLCAPQDQWIKGYFEGNEPFAITNMHPEFPVIQGTFPGLYPRCFIRHTINSDEPQFGEFDMNLDTVWFFPEKMLALLIWRKGIEVADDEAEQITHTLLAYEDRKDQPRDIQHYREALELRMNSDDPLLINFNTEDLVPVGHMCAMELLQEATFAGGEESELSKNMEAKADSINKTADEKVEEAIEQAEKNMEKVNDLPDEVKAQMPDGGKIDLKKMTKEPPEGKPDPDEQALNLKLESILPGITSGDPKKLELKKFSFDKMDQMVEAVEEFSDKKEKQAMELVSAEIAKARDQINDQLGETPEAMKEMLEEDKAKLEKTLKMLDDFDQEEAPMAPLPRINAEEILGQLSQISPQVMSAMQHVDSMKDMEIKDKSSRDLEKQIEGIIETQNQQAEEGLRMAEEEFKEGYFMGAHFMENGLSPHADPEETVAERLLKAVANGQDVSNGDWACLDLSGQNLDGVDLSGAYLEQVNFKGASLKRANLEKAIMARADLTDADLTGANLAEANVGGVHALRAKFTDANLKSAKLSKGHFIDADFTRSELEDVESMEVTFSGADFTEAHMPEMIFIESDLTGAKFPKADLGTTIFIDCDIKDADFTGASMTRCIFADTRLTNVCFDGADLSGSCFAATDPEKAAGIKNVRFRGACLKQCNFQGMEMQGTDLAGADLENSNFGEADLSNAVLIRAYAKRAQFRKARLAGARLDEINLMEGSLGKAYLVDASFVGANLYLVDFLRSTIKRTDFSGANLDNTIIEGWRPK